MALDYTVPSTPVTTAPATTYELPNFVGELFSLIPAQTPLLSMAGGLTGGKSVMAKEFTWQVEDNAAVLVNRSRLEGADPIPTAIIRQEVKNVVEIHLGPTAYTTKRRLGGQLRPVHNLVFPLNSTWRFIFSYFNKLFLHELRYLNEINTLEQYF